jgi:hypothetical protein
VTSSSAAPIRWRLDCVQTSESRASATSARSDWVACRRFRRRSVRRSRALRGLLRGSGSSLERPGVAVRPDRARSRAAPSLAIDDEAVPLDDRARGSRRPSTIQSAEPLTRVVCQQDEVECAAHRHSQSGGAPTRSEVVHDRLSRSWQTSWRTRRGWGSGVPPAGTPTTTAGRPRRRRPPVAVRTRGSAQLHGCACCWSGPGRRSDRSTRGSSARPCTITPPSSPRIMVAAAASSSISQSESPGGMRVRTRRSRSRTSTRRPRDGRTDRTCQATSPPPSGERALDRSARRRRGVLRRWQSSNTRRP